MDMKEEGKDQRRMDVKGCEQGIVRAIERLMIAHQHDADPIATAAKKKKMDPRTWRCMVGSR
jgi:hypothetical protein